MAKSYLQCLLYSQPVLVAFIGVSVCLCIHPYSSCQQDNIYAPLPHCLYLT